jgi:thioredoxin 2
MTIRTGRRCPHAVSREPMAENESTMTDTLQVVCPRCGTTNRVPAARLESGGKCGRCHSPLFDGHPVSLDAAQFARHIANSDIPLLVDFWAAWCAPCKIMAPVFEQAAVQLQPHVRLVKIDTEQNRELSARLGIRSIPTLALYKGGRETARIAGAMDLKNLLAWTRQHI